MKKKITLNQIINIRDNFLWQQHGIKFYPFQKEISDKILSIVFFKTIPQLNIEAARQCGKTEAITRTIEFLMIFFPAMARNLGLPTQVEGKYVFRVGIFAPQKEQVKTDFDRIKSGLRELERNKFEGSTLNTEESNATTLQLANGSFCYIFPLTEISNPESKTLDLAVFEEANKISDKQKKDKADPMLASTGGAEVSAGVGNYAINYFQKRCQTKQHLISFDYKEIIKQKQKQFEIDGNKWHLNYKNHIDERIAEWGIDDESFRTQYALEDVLGSGQFATGEDLDAMATEGAVFLDECDEPCVAGLDTAKSPDSTVLIIKTVGDKLKKIKGRIVSILELQGDNYKDQYDIIVKRLDKFNIKLIAIDSTGQGDFMPDMFENGNKYEIERVKFSLSSKDTIYKRLQVVIRERSTELPEEIKQPEDIRLVKFRQQILDLQKQYKGEYLSVKHPEGSKGGEIYHDDYPDSWALCEYADALYDRLEEPSVTFI